MRRVLKIAVDVSKDTDVADLEKHAARVLCGRIDAVPLAVLDVRIADEINGLSTRTLRVLQREKIRTIGDLVKCSEKDILALKGMGAVGLDELGIKLEEFGLRFKT